MHAQFEVPSWNGRFNLSAVTPSRIRAMQSAPLQGVLEIVIQRVNRLIIRKMPDETLPGPLKEDALHKVPIAVRIHAKINVRISLPTAVGSLVTTEAYMVYCN